MIDSFDFHPIQKWNFHYCIKLIHQCMNVVLYLNLPLSPDAYMAKDYEEVKEQTTYSPYQIFQKSACFKPINSIYEEHFPTEMISSKHSCALFRAV